MKSRELDEVIAALRRYMSRNEGFVTDPHLRTALREFKLAKRGGTLDQRRITRASKLVITFLVKQLPEAERHRTTKGKKKRQR